MTAEAWRIRACGLLAALDVASIEELANTTELPFEAVSEAAQEFENASETERVKPEVR